MIISAVLVITIMASLVISTFALANSIMFDQSVYAVDNCDATSTCENDPGTGSGNTQTNNCTNFSDCTNEAGGNNQIQTNRCDSVPECFNTGLANDMRQSIQCRNVSSCANFGGSERLSQSIECTDVAGSCANGAFVTSNTNQELRCISIGESGCSNESQETISGPENTPNEQKLVCAFVSSGCNNLATGNQIDQNLLCVLSTQCTNESNIPVVGNTQKSVCVNSGTCQNDGIDTRVVSVLSDNCESDDAPGSITICVNNRIINRPNS